MVPGAELSPVRALPHSVLPTTSELGAVIHVDDQITSLQREISLSPNVSHYFEPFTKRTPLHKRLLPF